MPEFKDSELFGFFREQFRAMNKPDRIWCLAPARNRKGRDVALVCYLEENSDKTVQLVPVARMIDPAHRGNYDIADELLAANEPEKKAA